jgi:uncharacterized membrane protein YjfL (UPF0719 family)
MLEDVAQVLVYSGVGLVILVVGFAVFDAITPGRLGAMVMEGNPNAAILAATTIASLGLVMWFAIFFTGAGWDGLDDAIVFGAVGVATQAIGFALLEMLTPGRMRDVIVATRVHPAIAVWCSVQIAVALVVCASLT